jgi:integrase
VTHRAIDKRRVQAEDAGTKSMGGHRVNGPAPAQEVTAPMQSQRSKPARHVPTKTTGIYYSFRANGKKVFECRYTDSNGRRRYQAVGTFEAAKARLAEVTGKKFKGEVVANVSITVGELIEGWRAIREAKASTRVIEERNIRLYIEPRWKRVKVRDVTKVGIQEWLRGLKRQDGRDGSLSDGTKALVLAHFRSILDHGVDAGVLTVNPVNLLGRKQKPRQGTLEARILGPGELDALLDGCGKRDWLRDIIVVTVNQALRLGEALGLRWKDVDFERGTLRIERQLGKEGEFSTPKGGAAAEISLMPEARRVLLRLWMAAGRPSDGPVFRNGFGGYRRYRDVQRAFVDVRAGLSTDPRAFRFHDLRHTAISRLANAPSAVFPQVQSFARHATLTTTLGYVHKIENAEWTEQAAAALAGL